ncbi:hypothetical protein [Burkholderia ubonensis]|uniref:Uncharacterized protein n=1 Tax=Burkholderia ubonensis TaxID=101571 RepID=A0ABD4E9X0_9BURK|nr:hypothetical protein [Burkholderia ubonensis]KVN92561.1 hypothetical protein WJ68_33610 [Burkholderia ubonensis]KVZ57539.1 hypothetical protein WL19_03485 [Burkholderia ubonensis]
MELKSQEHYDLIANFERTFNGRFDKEPKHLWPMGVVYQDGQVNALFDAYRKGYALHKGIANLERA